MLLTRSIGKCFSISETNSTNVRRWWDLPDFRCCILDRRLKRAADHQRGTTDLLSCWHYCQLYVTSLKPGGRLLTWYLGPYCWLDAKWFMHLFYVAYFSARVLAGGSSFQDLDDGKSAYAAYALYNEFGSPFKVPPLQFRFRVSGITSTSVSGRRFTGAQPMRLLRVDQLRPSVV
ncbi:hypothetical protein BJ742DRAFT_575850 [Cladochytrium replicatum]|nr:hypothetical protein BJ742DRAFT_575850 [Cladochytrium replicatum]